MLHVMSSNESRITNGFNSYDFDTLRHHWPRSFLFLCDLRVYIKLFVRVSLHLQKLSTFQSNLFLSPFSILSCTKAILKQIKTVQSCAVTELDDTDLLVFCFEQGGVGKQLSCRHPCYTHHETGSCQHGTRFRWGRYTT